MNQNAIDKIVSYFAPSRGLSRIRARAMSEVFMRSFDAASAGRRTDSWPRRFTDANAANGPALATLRAHARDLKRNNGWAQNGLRVIGRNTVGWGILPSVPKRFDESVRKRAADLFREWGGESTQCDASGRMNFFGIQRQIVECVAQDGEVLVRRRSRRPEDGLAIPLQLQVLEADFLDITKDGIQTPGGGEIVQGVEFDAIGRRVAYWLFEKHPGSASRSFSTKVESRRVPADGVVHVFRNDRPGAVRGFSWLSAAVVALKDFDEYEDATIVRQKIAAMFAAFVSDPDGGSTPLGTLDTAASASAPAIESLEPGMIHTLPVGKTVTFSSPPSVVEGGFDERTLRKVAVAFGVTYEDLTGDYSKVNFSSARLARIAHQGNVHDWRWNMLVPQFNDVAWDWAMNAAFIAGLIGETPRATWTPPPMPMIEPDKEGLALGRMVRVGAKTFSEMMREQGYDPEAFLEEYAADLKRLDELGIKLDSDVRATTQQGLSQQMNAKKGAAKIDTEESEASAE